MSRLTAPRVLQILSVFYLLEAGSFLVIAPWSRLWLRKVVSPAPELLQAALGSPYFRSFIVGIGMLHLYYGFRDLGASRRRAEAAVETP